MSAEKHRRDGLALPDLRPGILRVFQQAVIMALLLVGIGCGQHIFAHPRNCIRQHQRGQLAARQHIIPDRDLLIRDAVDHALIHALVVPAEQKEPRHLRKLSDALLGTDFKEFHLAGHALGISQITTMDSKGMMRRAPEFLEEMEKRKTRQGYDMMLLMITDVLKEGTWLLFTGDREIIRQAFAGSSVKENRVFLPGVVSRKKQVVPALSVLWG